VSAGRGRSPARDSRHDAVVVGSGPNGLAAAVALARAGRSVLVVEARDRPGGGARSAELTLPGFVHDVCSAIHPLALGSPFLRSLPLDRHGLAFLHPDAPLAHPLDGGRAVVLERSLAATAAALEEDERAYRRVFGPLVRDADRVLGHVLGPLLAPPRHPIALARFGLQALRSADGLGRSVFRGEPARALFAGAAAHSLLPLERHPSAAFGLVLMLLGHAVGWPVARGGSQSITDALVSYLESLGGHVECRRRVDSLDELPASGAVLLDLTPKEVVRVAGDRLPDGYRRRLERYRFGPGVCKVDWALDGPIPWQAPACARAATVHLGGTLEEIAASERAVWRGRHPERPYVLLAQQTLVDPTRAPPGRHTAWAYCHVPNSSPVDMTAAIERQVERYAHGFRERILARHTMPAVEVERYNPNFAGGDVNGGASDLRQLFTRPVARLVPYTTPVPGLLLCSSATPPGGGVHGMAGFGAAQAALRGPLRD
jgi:phytoene dehydrogenase-like protein